MFIKKVTDQSFSAIPLRAAAIIAVLTVAFVLAGNAQTEGQAAANVPAVQTAGADQSDVNKPVLTNYKDVKIGSTADQVREKLGKAKIDDNDGFYYEIGDGEFAQIRVDEDKKVRFLSVTYSKENKSVPEYSDIFGAQFTVAPAKPDGSVYELVRYPHAGYWVAYSRTAGNDPSVTVTMQKMQ